MEYQSKSSLRNASQIDLGASRKWPELPLSAAQLGIWFAQELAPSNVDFNGAEYVEIFGAVDPAIFETALRCVVAEADVLSVRFVKYTDGPRQVVGDPPDWSLPFIDVSAEPNPLAAARAWMDADRARPIDLLRGPLFAYALFKVAGDRFYWYARYHHILLDARGRWLIASRLAHVYSALATGLKPDDSTLGSQSVLLEDAAAYRASNDFVSDRQYWLRTLTDLPEVDRSQHPSLHCFERIHTHGQLRAVFDRRATSRHRARRKLAPDYNRGGRDLRASHDKGGGSSHWPAGCGPCKPGHEKRSWHGDKLGAD